MSDRRHKDHPLYWVWESMVRRCRDPRVKSYGDYGGRGIKVCDRWAQSFDAFVADMGCRPTPGHTIEREDNDGDYSPENCRWATRKEQNRNSRKNKRVEFEGQTRTVSEWAEVYGLDPINLNKRLRRGWSVRDALLTPNTPGGLRARLSNFQAGVLRCLRENPSGVATLAEATGRTPKTLYCTLCAMVKAGWIERVSWGVYAITDRAPDLGRDVYKGRGEV